MDILYKLYLKSVGSAGGSEFDSDGGAPVSDDSLSPTARGETSPPSPSAVAGDFSNIRRQRTLGAHRKGCVRFIAPIEDEESLVSIKLTPCSGRRVGPAGPKASPTDTAPGGPSWAGAANEPPAPKASSSPLVTANSSPLVRCNSDGQVDRRASWFQSWKSAT
jgi:hypothetical protein